MRFYIGLLICFFSACTSQSEQKKVLGDSVVSANVGKTKDSLPTSRELPADTPKKKAILLHIPSSDRSIESKATAKTYTNLDEKMRGYGLVDIQTILPNVIVDLKYSTKDNFMGVDLYEDLEKCYLQAEVANMLKVAQSNLQKAHAGYRFIVYDGARPFSIQQKMWEKVKGTPSEGYVAKPDALGSIHNYGGAVDLSVVDEKGTVLDMGTPYDFFGNLAQPRYEQDFLKQGKLTQKQIDNRLILRDAMHAAGFKVIPNEWWHFNAFPNEITRAKFKKVP